MRHWLRRLVDFGDSPRPMRDGDMTADPMQPKGPARWGQDNEAACATLHLAKGSWLQYVRRRGGFMGSADYGPERATSI